MIQSLITTIKILNWLIIFKKAQILIFVTGYFGEAETRYDLRMFDAGHGCCWDAGWVSTFARSPAVSLSSSSPGHPGKRKEFLLKQIRSLRLSWRCTTAGRLRHLARSQGCVMPVQVDRFREGKVPGWEVGWIFLAAMWNLGYEVVFHFSVCIETPSTFFVCWKQTVENKLFSLRPLS